MNVIYFLFHRIHNFCSKCYSDVMYSRNSNSYRKDLVGILFDIFPNRLSVLAHKISFSADFKKNIPDLNWCKCY